MSEKKPVKASRKPARGVLDIDPKHVPYIAPWALSAAAMPTSWVTNALWGNSPGMTAALGGVSVVITYATNKSWGKRSEHTRTLATVFAGAEAGWITAATATDPFSSTLVNAWLLGVPTLSILWGVRHAGLAGASDEDRAGASQRDSIWERVRGLKGRGVKTLKVVEPAPGRLEVTAQLPAGEMSVGEVRSELEHLAGSLQIDASALSVQAVPGRADQITLAIQPVNSLGTTVKWPGASAPGKSIADAPLAVGARSNGKTLEVWIVGSDDEGDPRPLPHTLVTGMTGSGKTETVATLIVDMRSRIDVVPVVADPAKFAQSFGDIEEALGLAAKGPDQVNRLIGNIPPAIAYRAQLLGGLGYKQWEPECWTKHRIPLVFIDIEEAADVLEGNDKFDEAIRKARSVGIALCASLQVATYSNIDRKTRGQFANSLAHGCSEDQDAKFALNTATLLAGADPTKWKSDSPGSLYAETVGTPRDEWSVDSRAFRISKDQKKSELDASRGTWAAMDEGTFEILSKGIDSAEPEEKDGGPLRNLPAIPEDFGTLDTSRPIPAMKGPGVSWGAPQDRRERMSTEEARLLFERRVDELEGFAVSSGKEPVADAREFVGLIRETGRSRAWIYAELERLAAAGRLEQGHGKAYRIVSRVS